MSTADDKVNVDPVWEAVESVAKMLKAPTPSEKLAAEGRLLVSLDQVREVTEASAILVDRVGAYILSMGRAHGVTCTPLVTGALRLQRALKQLGYGPGLMLGPERG